MAGGRIPVGERRQALVDAAMRVMEREGIAAATTRAVCSEAGMRSSFFHYCFTSKQELMLEVAQQFRRHFLELFTLTDELEGDVRAVVTSALTAFLADVAADPDIHQLTYELPLHALREEDLAGIAQRCYEDNELVAAEFLSTVADITGCDWTEPRERLARYLAVAVDGTVLQWLMLRDDGRVREHIADIAEHLSRRSRPRRGTRGPRAPAGPPARRRETSA